jgi:hypothetical protein
MKNYKILNIDSCKNCKYACKYNDDYERGHDNMHCLYEERGDSKKYEEKIYRAFKEPKYHNDPVFISLTNKRIVCEFGICDHHELRKEPMPWKGDLLKTKHLIEGFK